MRDSKTKTMESTETEIGTLCETATLEDLWAMRLVVHHLPKRVLGKNLFTDDDFLGVILETLPEPMRPATLDELSGLSEEEEKARERLLSRCRAYLRALETRASRLRFRQPLERNLRWMQARLNLSEAETRLLGFGSLCVCDGRFFNLTGEVERNQLYPHRRLHALLGSVLDLDRHQVARALGREGQLSQTGLIEHDSAPVNLHDVFDEMPEVLADALSNETDPLEERLDAILLHPAHPPTLEEDDYPHCPIPPRDIARYLRQMAAEGMAGVNVLIYGPPGTGKTELARLLADMSDLDASEIPCTDTDGLSMRGTDRLRRYRVLQAVYGNTGGRLVVFDEVEDVFPSNPETLLGHRLRGDYQGKAWLNNLMESNPVPAIWICNDPDGMDPALVRRFDLVMELSIPPRKQRLAIAESALGDLKVSGGWLNHLASHPHLSPAMLSRVRRVIDGMQPEADTDHEKRIEDILNGWLRAMSLPPLPSRTPTLLGYHPDLLNTDHDVGALANSLGKAGFGRLFLYGPPGPGKTAFARHLAKRLGKELLIKRASDILGPYVGQTEHAIAGMFHEARLKDAVLLIDEADSLFRNREHAERSWEITQVNEILTQMEDFQGYLIVSTNFEKLIDLAAMRRFDVRIRFSPLDAPQATGLFERILRAHGQRANEDCRQRLSRMSGLTPGDFNAAVRRIHISGEELTAERLLEALARELEYKAPARGIGFHAAIA